MWLFRNILFYLPLVVVFQITCNNYLSTDRLWFTDYVIYSGSGLLFLVIAVKWKIKWTGIRTLTKKADKYNFVFNKPLQPAFLYWTKFNHISEICTSLAFGGLVLLFDRQAWIFSAMLMINGIENIFFLYRNLSKQNFRIAVNEYAVVHNGRGTYILPFDQLQSIERKYEEFFFIYKNGETLTIPLNAMTENDLGEFRNLIDKKAREKEIFFSVRL